jgi:L-alanine-DL-glutamate epimerase-like enolase superfamily enzyme
MCSTRLLRISASNGTNEAIRRAGRLAELDLAWIEEPLPADDLDGHARLPRADAGRGRRVALFGPTFVARIGGITPWLKVARAAEAFDIPVCPHFLMGLHVSLACAVPNGKYIEFIPQLDELTTSSLRTESDVAPMTSGIGVEWDLDALKAKRLPEFNCTFR